MIAALAAAGLALVACPEEGPGAQCAVRGGAREAVFRMVEPLPSSRPGEEPDVRYAWLGRGRRVGTVHFERPGRDARQQEIPPGTYALHYALQPRLKDHVDTADARDFLVLVPDGAKAADETEAIALSRAASAAAHPLVLELATLDRAERPGEVTLAAGRARLRVRLPP